MKKNLTFILASALILNVINSSLGCTNFLITKGASTDGSTMISYSADSHTLYGELYFRPAADYPVGTLLKIYEWDSGKFLGEIPQILHTYAGIGNMNEHQLSIGETTYGGREELSRQPGAIMDYGSLIYIALQRAKTAREAIKVIAELMDKFGYASSGESFSIADKDEVWIMEIIGKGVEINISPAGLKNLATEKLPADIMNGVKKLSGKIYYSDGTFSKALEEIIGKENTAKYIDQITKYFEKGVKGAVWVALQIPDGYISGHANQARITTFDYQATNKFDDKSVTCFNAPDVISFAKSRGWFSGDDKDFSFSDTYAPVDFHGARFCEIRVWSMFKEVNKDMQQYLDYAKGQIVKGANGYATNRMPLWIKPDRKISIQDMMNFMRDHLDGTELDMTKDIGAGPHALPYRWRPLTWKVDGHEYCNERATATQQTGFSFVAQARNWLADPIGGIFWFSVDDAGTSVYCPMYCGMTSVPESYKQGNGDLLTYSPTSAFWAFTFVSNFSYLRYDLMSPEVKKVQSELESKYIAFTPAIDKAAVELYKTNPSLALEFITDYSVNTANTLVDRWHKLGQYLLVKYMDGNVKKEENGKFKYNPYGLPVFPDQPGYPEWWLREIIKQTGDKLKVTE